MLDCVSTKFLQPNKKEITVYKIFMVYNDRYINVDYNLGKLHGIEEDIPGCAFEFPKNDWISCYIDSNEKKWNDITLQQHEYSDVYPCGFHSFMDLNEAFKIYNFKYRCHSSTHVRYVLCECRAKFRLAYGIEKYILSDEIIDSKVCVSRGIKILKEYD